MADRLLNWRLSRVTMAEWDLLLNRKARFRIGRVVMKVCDWLARITEWIACIGPRPFFWLTYYLRDVADERIIRGVASRGPGDDR